MPGVREPLRTGRSRGVVAVYAVICFAALIGVISFAVDFGRVQMVKTELQRTADAAARAAASQVGSAAAVVQATAVYYGTANRADNTAVVIDPLQDVEIGDWDPATRTFAVLANPLDPDANAVRVTARRTAARGNAVPLIFAAVLGKSTCDAKGVSIAAKTTVSVDYSAGFPSSAGLALNGSCVVNSSALRLTTTTANQAGSCWYAQKLPIGKFSTTFRLLITSPVADGCTFTIQNNATTTCGGSGGSLGYQGMNNSVAVKFDIYNNGGEGTTSTGLYQNGASPMNVGSVTTSPTLDLRSAHVMRVQFDYDGATLTQTITDLTTLAIFTRSYTVNIPSVVGGTTAYVGFTGGTGGSTAQQVVQSWTYTGTGPLSTVR